MDNWLYRMKNPWTTFDVVEELDKSEKAVLLRLVTPRGIREIWCPRRDVEVLKRVINGRNVHQALIPEWLVQKAGLV